MKITIVGDGSFGSFLKELLALDFEICDQAESVILAVPLSVYNEVASLHEGKHLINVCSVQTPSTNICLQYSNIVTSIHPLFGRRTPTKFRNSIITYNRSFDDTWDSGGECLSEFVSKFRAVSKIITHDENGMLFTPESHDRLMERTHLSAVMAARQLKIFTDRAANIPDEMLPHSFRLMKDFVKTLDDMPPGTMESILANPYL